MDTNTRPSLEQEQAEARALLPYLLDHPMHEPAAAALKRALDSGDPCISDDIHEAKYVLGLFCLCGAEIEPDQDACSLNCWIAGGGMA